MSPGIVDVAPRMLPDVREKKTALWIDADPCSEFVSDASGQCQMTQAQAHFCPCTIGAATRSDRALRFCRYLIRTITERETSRPIRGAKQHYKEQVPASFRSVD